MQENRGLQPLSPVGNVTGVDATETSSSSGQQDRAERPILEPQAYQNTFERIENAIFVRSAN